MIAYLIKSNICLGLLLLVYFLFLEREKMHRFNRWYLLYSIVFSCIVPLINFTVTSETPAVLQSNYIESIAVVTQPTSAPTASAVQPPAKTELFPISLLFLYGSICLVLLVRFGRNLFMLLRSTLKARIIHYKEAKLVLLQNATASYSFLNYIFINEKDYSSQTLQNDIIRHELTHVKQKHSWDVIFIELLQIAFWFNPLLILYKKAIQLNHEFLADESVVKQCDDVHAYQYLLLDKAILGNQLRLSSPLNFSVTKKRLLMMTKNYNQRSALLKKLFMLPLFSAAVLVFSTRQMLMAQEKKEETKTVAATQTEKKNKPRGPVLIPGELPVTSKTGVSESMLKEYNDIIDRALTVKESGLAPKTRKMVSFSGTQNDRNRLVEIFKQMNAEQRFNSKIVFSKRLDVPAKTPISESQFQKWKNPADYGVWIDGKKVTNDALNKYQPSDFSHYFASNLAYTQKMKEDVMKSFNLKTMYKVQLNLTTNDEYVKWVARVAAEPELSMAYFLRHDDKHTWLMHVD